MKKEELEKELKETKKELQKTKKALNFEKVKEALTWKNVGYAILMAAWVFTVCIVTQIALSYLMLWIIGRANFKTPLWTTIYAALVYVVSGIIIIFVPKLIKKKWKTSREELGLTGLPTYTDMGISVLGFVATIIISNIVTSFLQALHLINASQAQDVGYDNLANPSDRIIAFLALVVFAPIAEEIIFRGWLYGKTRKKYGVTLAIIVTSVCFGALHFQWNVGITVGIMSVIMCIERELTGTIYAGILTHMIKNGVAFWLLYVLM